MRVNVISASGVAKGQGVHSAFTDMVNALREKKIDVVMNDKKGADILHFHTVGTISLWKLLFNKEKKVVSAHITPESMKGSLILSRYWLWFFKSYLLFFYNHADLVLAVSPNVKLELELLGVKKPIKVLPNLVDRDMFRKEVKELPEKYHVYKKEFVIIGVGQISPRKDIFTFIEVAKHLPNCRFLWVGGRPFGNLTAGVKECDDAIKAAPKNVEFFTEVIPREEMPLAYQVSDVFFLPSKQETFGIVVVEAAACGLPIILRDLDVYKEIFQEGYLKGNGVKDFVKIIKKLRNKKSFYRMWQDKSQLIADKYDKKKIANQLLGYYHKLLKDSERGNKKRK